MKIFCVVGGSYKSFYVNHFFKISKCDLLIFNYGIIYDYDSCEEVMGNAIVTKELMALSQKLHCVVLAGIFKILNGAKVKSIILCDGDKIHLAEAKHGVHLHIKNYDFVVGDESINYSKYNKILLCSKRTYPIVAHCSSQKIYLFIDPFGVDFIENKKLTRKFSKLTKIILK